ncbi:MAG: hypothetical protein ACRCSB_00010 [Bacteroidales bacterium]
MKEEKKIPHGFKIKSVTKGDTHRGYANRVIKEYEAGTLIMRTPKQATIIKRYLAAKKKNFYIKPK